MTLYSQKVKKHWVRKITSWRTEVFSKLWKGFPPPVKKWNNNNHSIMVWGCSVYTIHFMGFISKFNLVWPIFFCCFLLMLGICLEVKLNSDKIYQISWNVKRYKKQIRRSKKWYKYLICEWIKDVWETLQKNYFPPTTISNKKAVYSS